MVRFALVTLVYNKERFLKQCIDSALNQTTKDFIYFIVNDGSTDGSENIITNYQSKFSNIVYFPFKDKCGQMPRYNFVLNKINKLHPKIEYMGHLDGDDLLLPTAIQDMMNYFDKVKNRRIGHVSSLFSIIDANGSVKHKIGRSCPNLTTQEQWRRAQVTNNLLGHFRVMRIDCLNKVGGFDESFKYSTDFNMACRMLDKFSVDVCQKVLYLWRQHGGQVEGMAGKKQNLCWKQMQQHYKKRWKI